MTWLATESDCLGQKTEAPKPVVEFGDLEVKREQSKRSYHSFLNVDSMHCGIYCLAAGAKDHQKPHTQDEVYYVQAGVAKINISGTDYDLKAGSIVFIPAHAKHHFHSITEDLKTLVFFSKGPIQKAAKPAPANDKKIANRIESALIFNATMDGTTDCNLFDEDGWHYRAASLERKELDQKGAIEGVELLKDAGVSGDCLRFAKKTKEVMLYKSKESASFYPKPDWAGSISFFLKVDPNKDLGDVFCDPIQVAGRKWNDASIWCDFDKNASPKTFRMGVYSDLAHWNPKKLKLDEIPKTDLPLITVENPPFSSDRWTHVLMTFQDINSTQDKATVAKLYLNGKLSGQVSGDFRMTWNDDDPVPAIMMGLNYVGGFDELAIYNRALNDEEASYLNRSMRK